MRCANCGTNLNDNAKFCSNCGRKLNIVRVTVEGDVLRPPSLPGANRSIEPSGAPRVPQRPRNPQQPRPGGQSQQRNNHQGGGRNRPRPNAEQQRRTHLGIPPNLGGDGALVIYTSETLRGTQIQIYIDGTYANEAHAVVGQRRVLGQPVFAAVFPRIPTGKYRVYTSAPPPITYATVFPGAVAEIDWRKY